MHNEQRQVALFHEKIAGENHKAKWKRFDDSPTKSELIDSMIDASHFFAGSDHIKDVKLHLMLEELSEFILAEDEIEAFDALCDLLYVTLANFELYDWPADSGFQEVHRSNMTKKPANTNRVSDKGGDYDPPKLNQVLDVYRKWLELRRDISAVDLSLAARKRRKEQRLELKNNASQKRD